MFMIFSFGSSLQNSSTRELVKSIPKGRIKSFSPATHFLVTDTVLDSNYRTAVSLGIPIVKEEFVWRCAQESVSCLVEARSLIPLYKLPLYCGLNIAILGFDQERMEKIAFEIETYGGQVVSEVSQATHVIVSSETRIPNMKNQKVVSEQWLDESLNLGWCANEAPFEKVATTPKLCRSARVRRTIDKQLSRSKSRLNTNSKYKRYELCMELLKSEINCLKHLDFLLRLREESTPYLTESQNDVIFSSFLLMKEVHQRLVEKMGAVIKNWNDYSVVGNIFVEEEYALECAYMPYFHGLEASLEMLKDCKAKNSRFRAFAEMKEKDRTLEKQKLEYLLNGPYQQLTSRVGTLLKEIHSKTSADSPDFACLANAIESVATVLRKSNESKKINAESEAIYKQIEEVPAWILCSSRTYITRLSLMSLSSESEGPGKSRLPVELLLFQDSLMITRRLIRSTSCVSLHSLSGAASRKKLRYIQSFPMSCVRAIRVLELSDNLPVLTLILRDGRADFEWLFQTVSSLSDTVTFLKKLASQVHQETCREVIVEMQQSSALDDCERYGSPFTRSISSTSAFGKLRSYSQRLRGKTTKEKIPRFPTTPLTSREKRMFGVDHDRSRDYLTFSSAKLDLENSLQPPIQNLNRSGSHTPKQSSGYGSSNDSGDYGQEHEHQLEEEKHEHEEHVFQTEQQWSPITVEIEEEEVVDEPYEHVKYFTPLRNIKFPTGNCNRQPFL